MKEIYTKLCKLTQENMSQHNSLYRLHFETVEGLSESIFSYPIKQLLSIEDSDSFIRECFYKMLDRPVDDDALQSFSYALKRKKLTRMEFIQTIYDSEERIKKQTDLRYE